MGRISEWELACNLSSKALMPFLWITVIINKNMEGNDMITQRKPTHPGAVLREDVLRPLDSR